MVTMFPLPSQRLFAVVNIFLYLTYLCGATDGSSIDKPDSDSQCSIYNTIPLSSHDYKYMKLWPLHHNNNEHEDPTHHKTIYGFAHAIKKVYEHQHPLDCKKQKFFIFPGHQGGGFGSNLHIEGLMLAMAMNMGRIYLPHPRFSLSLKWPFEYPFCMDHHERNFNCYYETLSSCTYQDAFPQYNYSDPTSWSNDYGHLVSPPYGPGEVNASFASEHKVIRTALGSGLQARPGNVYPTIFNELLACGEFKSINDRNRWWHAISMAFQVRPNTRTLHQLAKFRAEYPILDMRKDQPVIGMYVRHGDKGTEMKLVPLSQYLEAAQSIWDQGIAHTRYHQKIGASDTSISIYSYTTVSSSTTTATTSTTSSGGSSTGSSNNIKAFHPTRNGTIFLGTEDPQVILDAVEWGRINGWKIIYTEVLDRKRLDAGHIGQAGGPYEGEYRHGHHELEYHSMLLNLEMLLHCAAWVGTMNSSYNRAVDELRNTIAAKADLMTADLVFDKPPFMYRGFYYYVDQIKLNSGS